MINLGDYILVCDAANKLGIHKKTLLRLVKSQGDMAVKVGGVWLMPRDEYEKLQRVYKFRWRNKNGAPVKLTTIGHSMALVLPKDWVRSYIQPDRNGNYWVRVDYQEGNIIITPA